MVWGLFPDKAMRCSVQYVLEVVGIKLKLLLDEDVVMMLDCVPFTYDLSSNSGFVNTSWNC